MEPEGQSHEVLPSYERFVEAGDKLYRRHLNVAEPANLLEETLNEYAKALEQNPDAPEVLVRVARTVLRQGNYAKAERLAQKALKASTEKAVLFEAHFVLGFIYYQEALYPKALYHLGQAVRHDLVKSSKARLLLYKTSKEAARSQNSFSAKLNHYGAALYQMVAALFLLPFEPERMSLAQAVQIIPRMIAAYYYEEFKLTDAALGNYLDLHQRFPGLACVSNIIGDIYREKNEPEKARYWFDKTILRHPAYTDAYYQLARIMEQKEDYQGVSDIYATLLRLKPADAHLHCNMGNTYYNLNFYKDALTHYETALHLGADAEWRALLAQSIGNIYMDALDNTEAAISAYQMAVILNPKDVESYIHLGLLYFQKQDYENAELVYKKAMGISPTNPRLYSNMGYLRWMEGDIDSAVFYYEQAIALDASYEIPLNNLGVIYLDTLGNVRKSVDMFKQAVSINDSYALAYYNLGRAYSFMNRRMEAATCFQTAKVLNATTQELDNEELVDRINSLFNPVESTEAVD